MDDDGLLKYTVKVLTNYHNLLKKYSCIEFRWNVK